MDILNFTGLAWPFALLCVVVYGAADRLWGASKPAFKGKKAVLALATLGVGFASAGLFGAGLGLTWLVYRSLPFFKGSACPQSNGERLASVFRNVVIVPPVAFLAQQCGQDVARVAYLFLAYSAISVTLATLYGLITAEHIKDNEPGGMENRLVEAARGGFFGLAVALTTGGLP